MKTHIAKEILILIFAVSTLFLAMRLVNIQQHPVEYVQSLSGDAQEQIFVALSSDRF